MSPSVKAVFPTMMMLSISTDGPSSILNVSVTSFGFAAAPEAVSAVTVARSIPSRAYFSFTDAAMRRVSSGVRTCPTTAPAALWRSSSSSSSFPSKAIAPSLGYSATVITR
jgi:hypothetical protein